MNETSTDWGESVTAEQKRAALEAVLRSNTFARSDQLKSFLKYVCEMEIAGHGHELTEYLIGVEALGRPSQYSPGDDSGVRNRAFALRKKLHEYYELENPDAPIRIDLHKGSYCPHFVEKNSQERPNGNGVSMARASGSLDPVSPPHDLPAVREAGIGEGKKKLLLGFIAGVVVTSLIAGASYLLIGRRASNSTAPVIAPILAEAWGPILNPHSDALICVANPPSFSLHTAALPFTPPLNSQLISNDPGGRPVPRELLDWYKNRFPTVSGQNDYLTITTNATYWGDSIGAMTVLRTMTSAGVIPQMFPEKVIAMPTLRRRNVILFGAPEYSPAITRFLEKCPLTVKYLNSIISRAPGQAPASLYSIKRDAKNRTTHVYGLITVLPSESSTDHGRRTVIFSGINSAGAQAAAELFSSPEHLIELRKHLNREGHNRFPPAYQVVVSAETDDSILLNFKYETHRLLPN
ncbi:MAG: hypothetical protein ACRD9Y_08480 [Blastocatellia bacterium]